MKFERPFWETSYSKADAATTFNKGKPSWDVIEVLENYLTNKKPPSPDMERFTKGLFEEGELFDLYADWVVHHKSSHTFEDDHDGGIHHIHAANRVIARKPANLFV